MTPGARLQAIIDLLRAIHGGTAPADRAVAAFFRDRRYVGAKDRRAVMDLTYSILRAQARLDWWIDRYRAYPDDRERARLIAHLAMIDGWSADKIAGSFDGGQYRPPPLSEAERRLAGSLAGKSLDLDDQPIDVRLEYPAWIEPLLKARFGAALEFEMRAALAPAATDLRVNTLKATRDDAIAALAQDGIVATKTRLSPVGLRVEGRPPLATFACFKDGIVEVQDEGSQIVALLLDAKPGDRVVDFCAGAGGKTLAIAAGMKNKGKIVALDILEGRIERSAVRLARAGVHNVERRALSGERDPWVKRHAGGFDRVLVDAPCTGTGTWRRNPDARWRLQPEDLAELVQLQRRILESAARLVKPGGRLVYATCSLLPAENEEQIAWFLAANPQFKLLPAPQPSPAPSAKADIRPQGGRRSRHFPLPPGEGVRRSLTGEGEGASPAASDTQPLLQSDYLSLTPARHGTDGFFAAILERAPKAAGFEIRHATPDEAIAIAEIHFAGWRRAYGDFLTPDQLAEKAPEKRAPLWRDWIADATRIVLVGVDEAGAIQGFVSAGPVLDHEFTQGNLDGFDCELYILHCRAEIEGQGLGRALIAALVRAFKDHGQRGLVLWAYRDNKFRAFYEKLGGQIVAEGLDEGEPDIAYGWNDLGQLIARCEKAANPPRKDTRIQVASA